MKVNFVTKEDDIRGVAVIELLSVLGYSTRILRNGGQPKSVMDIAVFTPVCDVGLDLPKKSRFQGGGKYFCCSGNKIKPKDTPVWAKLPLKIVVKEVHIPIYPYRRLVTKDFLFLLNQKNKKDELSDLEKFVHAVQVTARMFESWYPEKEGYAVPWKKYQNGEGANFLLNKEVGELLTRDDVVVAKKILTELKKHGGYYVRHPSRVLQVSPDFIELSAADAGTVSKNGGLLWDYWQQCILVYNHALSDKHLKWVVSSISGPLSSK
ncbi:hypothetical protein KAZ57_02160, partial [Patescibacteria group bacterium]|nr:hypothetical protein [Patescibacteria group bacterium]